MNAFEKNFVLAAILNLDVSRDLGSMCHIPNFLVFDSEHKSCSELTRLEQRFGSYFEKSAIWRPSLKMADFRALHYLVNSHHKNAFSINFYASNDI